MLNRLLYASLFAVSLCCSSIANCFNEISVNIQNDGDEYYKATLVLNNKKNTQTVFRIFGNDDVWNSPHNEIYATQSTIGTWDFFFSTNTKEVCFLSVDLLHGIYEFAPASSDVTAVKDYFKNKTYSITSPFSSLLPPL